MHRTQLYCKLHILQGKDISKAYIILCAEALLVHAQSTFPLRTREVCVCCTIVLVDVSCQLDDMERLMDNAKT